MKANFDSPELGESRRFEITLGLFAGWAVVWLIHLAGWFPLWIPLTIGPIVIINSLARHMKGDL